MTHQYALRRSRNHRMVAGVCGGLGEFFGLNPFWFRLGFLIALIPGGVPGLGVYLLAWLLIPNAPRFTPAGKTINPAFSDR